MLNIAPATWLAASSGHRYERLGTETLSRPPGYRWHEQMPQCSLRERVRAQLLDTSKWSVSWVLEDSDNRLRPVSSCIGMVSWQSLPALIAQVHGSTVQLHPATERMGATKLREEGLVGTNWGVCDISHLHARATSGQRTYAMSAR
jgi:hypothetical protein